MVARGLSSISRLRASSNFYQGFAGCQAFNDQWQELFNPTDQFGLARIANTYPDDTGAVWLAHLVPNRKILVLGQDDSTQLLRTLPNRIIGGGCHIHVRNMLSVVALRYQPTC